MVFLAANAILAAVAFATGEWAASLTAASARGEVVQPADLTLLQQLGLGTTLGVLVLMLGTPITFLRWLHAAHLRARELGGGHRLGFDARQAITAWFIPVVSFVRPMRVMLGLAAASDPTDLSPPTLEREVASPGYRDPARVVEQQVGSNPGVPVAAWWALWLTTGVSSIILYWWSRSGVTASGLEVIQRIVQVAMLAAAVLAVVVVRNIDIRQRERARRWDARTSEEDEDDVELERRAPRRPRKRSRRRRVDASTT